MSIRYDLARGSFVDGTRYVPPATVAEKLELAEDTIIAKERTIDSLVRERRNHRHLIESEREARAHAEEQRVYEHARRADLAADLQKMTERAEQAEAEVARLNDICDRLADAGRS